MKDKIPKRTERELLEMAVFWMRKSQDYSPPRSQDVGRMLECADYINELNKAAVKAREEPEPVGLPEDFRRIALLFTSRCTRTKMTKGEKTAWIRLGGIKEHDLVELEWFYALDKSADYDQTWHRKGQPAALLNNLNAQLDLAYEMKEGMRKAKAADPFSEFRT